MARALQKIGESARRIAVVTAVLVLPACSSPSEIGIWPNDPLPPAPAGPPPPYPSFAAPAADPDAPQVLTNAEREELEARLSRLAKERDPKAAAQTKKSK
jgi:hypothetical protein